MIVRTMRIVAVALMFVGLLLLATYFVSPLRIFWIWFRAWPLPLQIGSAIAAMGLAILLTTMVVDRVMKRKYDTELKRP